MSSLHPTLYQGSEAQTIHCSEQYIDQDLADLHRICPEWQAKVLYRLSRTGSAPDKRGDRRRTIVGTLVNIAS